MKADLTSVALATSHPATPRCRSHLPCVSLEARLWIHKPQYTISLCLSFVNTRAILSPSIADRRALVPLYGRRCPTSSPPHLIPRTAADPTTGCAPRQRPHQHSATPLKFQHLLVQSLDITAQGQSQLSISFHFSERRFPRHTFLKHHNMRADSPVSDSLQDTPRHAPFQTSWCDSHSAAQRALDGPVIISIAPLEGAY